MKLNSSFQAEFNQNGKHYFALPLTQTEEKTIHTHEIHLQTNIHTYATTLTDKHKIQLHTNIYTHKHIQIHTHKRIGIHSDVQKKERFENLKICSS